MLRQLSVTFLAFLLFTSLTGSAAAQLSPDASYYRFGIIDGYPVAQIAATMPVAQRQELLDLLEQIADYQQCKDSVRFCGDDDISGDMNLLIKTAHQQILAMCRTFLATPAVMNIKSHAWMADLIVSLSASQGVPVLDAPATTVIASPPVPCGLCKDWHGIVAVGCCH